MVVLSFESSLCLDSLGDSGLAFSFLSGLEDCFSEEEENIALIASGELREDVMNAPMKTPRMRATKKVFICVDISREATNIRVRC